MTSSGPGMSLICVANRPAASRYDRSSSTDRTASRTASGVTAPGRSTTTGARRFATVGVEEIVGPLRHEHLRKSGAKRRQQRPRATVADERVAMREQRGLRDVLLDVCIRRDRVQPISRMIATNGDDHIDRFVRQPVECGPKHRTIGVEEGSERHVDGRAPRQIRHPIRQALVDGGREPDGTKATNLMGEARVDRRLEVGRSDRQAWSSERSAHRFHA